MCPSIVFVLPSDAACIFLSLSIGAKQDDASLLDIFRLSALYLFFLLTDKKEDIAIPPAVVMPTPSKRGRKSKQVMGRVSGVPPPGSDALILAHLTAGGQVRLANIFLCVCVCAYTIHTESDGSIAIVFQHHTADPYDLSNDEDDHTNKDGPKSYR